MISTYRALKKLSVALFMAQLTAHVLAGTHFTSHVTVNTPARSFSHGVGDPVPSYGRKPFHRRVPYRIVKRPTYTQDRGVGGYPRVRPTVPFTHEEAVPGHSINMTPWNYNSFREMSIPVLPPSPYKVDSSDPESLWPEGLFLPPISPPRFGNSLSRADNGDTTSDTDPLDPYLLEGSEAVAAVTKAELHGELYFHEIPHIESLLANQEQRIKNKLKPHRLGSIRHTWPYNRP